MNLPVLTSDQLKAFASANPTQTIMPVATGRFIVPIPHLDDGETELKLPNAKELDTVIKSGNLGSKINSAKLEGFPQIIPTDGTQVVVINNISRRQAKSLQVLYDDILEENGGIMNRKALKLFFETATGIAYNSSSNTISLVQDNIGIHGDVYNMTRETFKSRHNPYGTETDLKSLSDNEIKAGHYQRILAKAQGFVIKGGFVREAETGTQQTFPDGAMIQIGAGVVSAIHSNDINVSYQSLERSELVTDYGSINLPEYSIKEVLAGINKGANGKDWRVSLGPRTGMVQKT